MKTSSQSKVFNLEILETSTGTERILRGGRRLFPLLPRAFEGIRQIAVIGWGSQGPAQAQNLRDSLDAAKSGIVVKVGLQKNSKSIEAARQAGFQVSCEPGESTVGTIEEVVPNSDLVILLIADGAQAKLWAHITGLMKPGATLGLSHGFLLGHLKSVGESFRTDINVILMAPKGMGKSVRLLYLQGATTDGAGINSSVAVEQDVNGRALDYALGWAVGTGSPATFFTTMEQEVISDLFGERAMLLGGLWGLSEALYAWYGRRDISPKGAFLLSAKGLTSTVSNLVSQHGLLGLYHNLGAAKDSFAFGYGRAYGPAKKLMQEIYAKVSSWEEITEVVAATEALAHTPMSDLEASEMWRTGKPLYSVTVPMNHQLAYSAGMYVGGIMAQMDTLRENGHCASEIVNESLIEAIDSLNPFMDKRGVSFMVDNCSTTARLGARKWGPRFQEAFLRSPTPHEADTTEFQAFLAHPLHGDIGKCFALRPSVRINLS